MGLKLGRPPGPGPVFEFEWLTATRRWQGYALRSFFVLFLLTALVVTWVSRERLGIAPTIRSLANIGQLFYIAVIGTQLTLVLLAAPAATAGAICLDRARGALAHLLLTDLTDAEIVLGKLVAQLVPVLGLVVSSLPVVALLTLLGGVDPDAMLGAFAVTLGLAVLGCALALVFSLWAGKTHEALLGTYAVWGLWLLGPWMVNGLNGAFGLALIAPPPGSNPFYLAFAPYWWPGLVGWSDYLTFLAVTWTIATMLVGVAVWRMRAVCTTENVRKPGRGLSRFTPNLTIYAAKLARLTQSFGPPLDFNPVLWREWHRQRPSRWARIVGTLYVALAVVFSLVAVLSANGSTPAWVNGLQVSAGLLLLSVSAATSLAEERVRGSLDVLLTTPLTTPAIVLGKWLGTYRVVLPLATLPALVVVGSDPRDWKKWVGAVLIAAFVFATGAAVTSLGLALATWCSRLGRAVGLTVTLYVLITVGWMFVVMAVSSHGPDAGGLMMASPFFGVGELTFDLCDGSSHSFHGFGWIVFWTFAYATFAVVLLGAVLVTFDRCLGRVKRGASPIDFRRMRPVELVRFEKVPDAEFAGR